MNGAPSPMTPSALSILLALALLGLALLSTALAVVVARYRVRVRRLEQENREAAERVRRANRAGDTFFDLVTHELRSPLAAILGYQELLQDGAYGEIGDSASDAVDRIGRSARHLLHLIDGVVEIGRLRSGGVRPRLEEVDLTLLVHMVAGAFRTHAAERHIPASVRIDPDLPTIRSDPERLVRALDLLVVSAVKHPGTDGLELHVIRHDDGATFRIRNASIPVRHDSDDLIRRLGMRIAAADGIAHLLGGYLAIQPPGEGPVQQLDLRIRDQDPADFDGDDRRG